MYTNESCIALAPVKTIDTLIKKACSYKGKGIHMYGCLKIQLHSHTIFFHFNNMLFLARTRPEIEFALGRIDLVSSP